MQEGIEQYVMEVEPSSEAKVVDSYVSLEDEGYEHCVVEDIEAPVVLDDVKEDNGDVDLLHFTAGGIIEPTLDMEFDSEDDARNFYNAYAKQTGFSIRVNSYYRSKKDNSIISREFCCSKEGFRRERRAKRGSGDGAKRRRARAITREGCKAVMTVRKRENERWYVAKLEKSHNHELVTTAMRHFLRSHKQDCESNQISSNSFSSPGMSLDAPMNVLSDCSSFGKMSFPVQSGVNYIGRGRLSTFGIDAQSLLGFFKIMQASDPAFYYAIQVDEEDRLSSVFWAAVERENVEAREGRIGRKQVPDVAGSARGGDGELC